LPLVGQIPPVHGKPGRPRRRPDALLADRGYDSDPHRAALRRLGIRPVIARRKTPHGSGLGRQRYVVERSIAWLHGFRRLRLRWERRADLHEALLKLACCLICWRCLQTSWCNQSCLQE
jgi:transposase